MLKIVDGDFGQNVAIAIRRTFWSQKIKEIVIVKGLLSRPIRIQPGQIAQVERVSDRASVNAGGMLVGAALGGVFGATLGSRGTATAFIVTLRDGRQFFAEGSSQDFQAFYGLTIGSQASHQTAYNKPAKRSSTGLHLVMTVLTCGLWLPIWLLASLRK